MKKFFYAIFIFVLGLSFFTESYSQEKEAKEMKETVKTENNVKADDGKPFNTICPVSGEEVDAKITYSHDGKTYAFCCNTCLKKFKKNPEKYSSRLSEDGMSMKKSKDKNKEEHKH